MSNRAVLLVVGLGLIGLGMLTGIATLVLPANTLPTELIWTVSITGVYAIGAMVVITAAGRAWRVRNACLGFAAVSLAAFILTIWMPSSVRWSTQEWIMRTGTIPLVISLTMVHRMVLGRLRPRSSVGRWSRLTGMTAGLIGAIIIIALVLLGDYLSGIYDIEEMVMRTLGVVLIVAAGASISAGLVWFFERRPEHDEPGLLDEGVPVSLTCPRCATAISARSRRDSRCPGCRLLVRVEVDEPRCSCGYLLYQLIGDTCPECGKGVRDEDRWGAKAGTATPGVAATGDPAPA
jgi:hypothetical protein